MLTLGEPCPPGLFEEFEIPRTQLPALPGEPVVLGLAEGWGELPQGDVSRLRAELDQLGAALLLISSRELVCLRPGVPPEAVVRSSRVRQLWPSGLGPWHRAPAANAAAGPGCASARRSSLTLAVIDEQGIVCWLWRSAQSGGSLEQLLAALSQARRQLQEQQLAALSQARRQLQEQQRLASGAHRRPAPPFPRAARTASLVSTFTATFGAGEARGTGASREGLERRPSRAARHSFR